MMRNILIITGFITIGVTMVACKSKDNPGRAYMPDMYYSRAYETYASTEALEKAGVHYNGMPVAGTIARGEMAAYRIPNDSSGYTLSASVKNPLDSVNVNMVEAERLYLVNCAICHGSNLDGNGPLYKDGNGPYTAKPATLVGDPKQEALPEGTMYHVVTYGKGAMGSYASQLSTQQRWMVVKYVKSKQKGKATAAAPATADSAAANIK